MITIRDAASTSMPVDSCRDALYLLRQLAGFKKMFDDFDADPFTLSKQTAVGAKYRVHVKVAYDISKPVGVVLYYMGDYSSFKTKWRVYLEDIFVEAGYQGRGVAQKLLREVATLAACEGCEEIAFSVLDWNTKAHAFYKKLGAEIEGTYTEIGGNTWIKMVFKAEATEAIRNWRG